MKLTGRSIVGFESGVGFGCSTPRLHDYSPQTIDPYRDCPEAEMRDAQVSVVGAVSIGSFELSR
jgi:hypothetical protein